MRFDEYLSDLKKLNLPDGQYAIFGSGPLAVRGLRDSGDLDVIIKESLWEQLSIIYPRSNDLIKLGEGIDAYKDWSRPFTGKVEALIDDAEIINGIRYVKLKEVLRWKQTRMKEKDIKDIELIKRCLGTNQD